MRTSTIIIIGAMLLSSAPLRLNAQSPPAPAMTQAEMEQHIKEISAALLETRQQMERSQKQMQLLEEQLHILQQQMAAIPSPSPATSTTASTTEEIREHEEVLDAEVKQQEQTKVESASKYPLRITGLLLFNSFLNRGVVDNIDMPALATRATAGTSNSSVGAGLRQTILGLKGNGPTILGAKTSATVSIDFFGGVSYSNFGTSSGTVRMRTADITLDWENDMLQAGLVGPLISPLSATSYATVAEPGMAWAGNLWTWAPQIRIEHRLPLQNKRHIGMEFGLWDSPSAGYSPSEFFRSGSPGELSSQPAYEARLSYAGADPVHGLQLGLGGYYSRQSYPASKSLDSWTGTADWRLPLPAHLEFSGEAYRGRSIGGLGGGVYKDYIGGTDPVSGANVMRGLNAIGGWSQLKWRPLHTLETNFAMGQDSGFASDFHAVVLAAGASATQLRARNQMAVGNLIYRPKTYLILSPEYRRIWTWPIIGPGATADVFTFTVGYQF